MIGGCQDSRLLIQTIMLVIRLDLFIVLFSFYTPVYSCA